MAEPGRMIKMWFEKASSDLRVAKLVKDMPELHPAIILTKFAVAYRYPEEADPPEPLNQQSCDKVYALAQWVYEEMKSRCPV